MGTYPSLPSKVLETDEDLQDVLDKHSNELIGQNVIQKFRHTKLPYLPKILSIAKALPLQLHPVRQNQFAAEKNANTPGRTRTLLQSYMRETLISSLTPTTSQRSRWLLGHLKRLLASSRYRTSRS